MNRLLTIGASLALLIGLSAFARGPADVVREDGSCGFFDGEGSLYVVECTLQTVSTNNDRGIVNLWGKGQLPDDAVLPDRALHFGFDNTGFTCGGSMDWHGTLTPKGRFSFSCKIH